MENPFTLEGKTILITGASSGIGRATAILCSKMGATLILTGRTASKLDEVFSKLFGEHHKKIVLDFEHPESINLLIDSIEGLDGLVHSAGITNPMPFVYTQSEELSRIMKINFDLPFSITRNLLKLKKINKNSSIVFVSSVMGFNSGMKGGSAYSASKGAISAFIRVLALELGLKKIRVNAICPGMVKTDFINDGFFSQEQLQLDELKYPLGYGTPEQVACSIVFLLGSGSSWITGTNLVIDGGVTIN
jgi:NAD(P)-dependent dehydrogenase (short-subunit alcohol dehydrogenase family)